MKFKIKKISIISSIAIILIILTSLFMIHINKENITKLNVINNSEKLAIEENILYKNLKEEVADSANCQYDTIDDGNIIITEYYGNKDCVIIPKEINGIKVEKISKDAFLISENLEIIKIPIKIAENNNEIDGFEKREELSNDTYTVFVTTKEYTEEYLRYINLNDEERSLITIIPPKFVKTWEEVFEETEQEQPYSLKAASTTIPSRYDLRNRISIQVSDQGSLGICYAYSSNTSVETNIALNYGDTVDLSEIDLAMRSEQMYGGAFALCGEYYWYYAYGPTREIPNTILSQKYVESQRNNNRIASNIWKSCESTAGENSLTNTEKEEVKQALENASSEPEYYVMSCKSFYQITGKEKNDSSYADKVLKNRNSIKEYVMNCGAVSSYIKYNANRYRDYGNIAVMCCSNNVDGGSHGVSIIGWDDNFSKSNFPSEWGVTQDGAWLALNSWGSSWGNGDGTFWISYQDYNIEYSNNVVTNISKGKVDIGDINKVNISFTSRNNTYNGSAKTPTTELEYNSNTGLRKNRDYTVTYSNNVNVGTGIATITGIGRYKGTVTKTFEITPKDINTSTVTVTLATTSYAYDGTAKMPAVTIKDGNTTLTVNRDYTVTYSNNTNAGTATVTVTGKGNYTGTATKTFTITAKNINTTTATLATTSYAYDGTAKMPAVTIKDGNITLTVNRDYTVTYSNNTNIGTATATITGIGNYTGTITKTFTITAKNINSTTVELAGTLYFYNATSIEPAVTVKDGNTKLTIYKDYTVTYSNNRNIGTATVTITGKGIYTGTTTKTFEIVQRDIKLLATVTLEVASYTYDGTAKIPTVTVEDRNTILTKDTDYTVAYSNNINVGTATVTITGKGNYTGTTTKTFAITAKNINTATVTLGATTYTYEGTAKMPAVTVKDGSLTLTKDTDYTVTYSNNTNVGTATVTITGKGNYTGTITKTFTITAKNINTSTVILEVASYTYDGTAKMPVVIVKDRNTILTKDTDYTVTYSNNTNVGTAKVRITGKGNYTEEKEISFEIQKGEYPYTIPSGLTAIYNSTLRDIKLPKGFNWEDDLDTKVGEAGYNTFKCTYTPEDTTNYNIVTGIEVIIEVKEKLSVSIEEYRTEIDEDNKITYLKGIEIGETLENVRNKIKTNGIVEVSEGDGIKIEDKDKISKTGMKLKVTKEKESVEYIIVVAGDNNGDGKITITDVVRANLYLTHIKNLQGEFAKAIDINNDGRVTITDIVKVKLKSVHM